ncbi:N-substituted formamide deformylase precursor [compost metagenome]
MASFFSKTSVVLCAGIALSSACSSKPVPQTEMRSSSLGKSAETVFWGGDIVTVDDAQPVAEAVAVAEGKILFVGSKQEAQTYVGRDTKVIDLQGKTLMPGFIDAHSHIAGYLGLWKQVNLNPPPVGDVQSIAQIIAKLKKQIIDEKIPEGGVVFGFNYDDAQLKEKRQPTAAELDRVSTKHIVLASHISGHIAVGNHLALKKAGIVKGFKGPEGGVIKVDKKGEPTGIVEEQAVMPLLSLLPRKSFEDTMTDFVEIQKYYASQGITTAQEGQTFEESIAFLSKAAEEKKLIVDVVSYPKWTIFNKVLSGEETFQRKTDTAEATVSPGAKSKMGVYFQGLKLGGIKITADGSPQGRTAYVTQPYMTPPPGQGKDYRGVPVVDQNELDKWADILYRENIQFLVHCNGDAAADMMISAVQKAVDKYGKKDVRPVMIHSQLVRYDQLDKMKNLGIIPSFFSAHTFYWGDWYINVVLGPERAARISPMATALKKGLIITNHTDAPVIPPNELMTVHTAVNRTTRTGKILGPNERISPMEALKAITINAAYQYFEENSKGSLKKGKLADLVVLTANPLTVDPTKIKDIKVVTTFKEGMPIYQLKDVVEMDSMAREGEEPAKKPL